MKQWIEQHSGLSQTGTARALEIVAGLEVDAQLVEAEGEDGAADLDVVLARVDTAVEALQWEAGVWRIAPDHAVLIVRAEGRAVPVPAGSDGVLALSDLTLRNGDELAIIRTAPVLRGHGEGGQGADPVHAFVQRALSVGITADTFRLQTAFWAPLPEISRAIVTPQIARSHARLTQPFWVLVHSSVYEEPGSDAVQQRIVDQLEGLRGRVPLPEGVEIPELLRQGALRIAIVVEDATTQAQAEAFREEFLQAFGLGESFVQAAVAADQDPAELHRALTSQVPGSLIGSVVGPAAWLDRVGAAHEMAGVSQVPFNASANGHLAAAGNAILAGIEVAARRAAVAAGDDRQPPTIPGRADVFRELQLPEQHDIASEEIGQAVAERRRRMRTLRASSLGV
jgi:hypothetical protein